MVTPQQIPEPTTGIWDKFLPMGAWSLTPFGVENFLGTGMTGPEALGKAAAPLAPVVEPAIKGINWFEENIIKPEVEARSQYFPIRWEPGPGALNFDWNVDAYKRADGGFDPRSLWDAFAAFRLKPEGIAPPDVQEFKATGQMPEGVFGENITRLAAPGTVREENILAEMAKKESELGRSLTPTEVREVSEDLYKLPPGMRGLLEEMPWAAIPAAGGTKGMKAGISATRLGPALRPAGTRSALGQFQTTGTLTKRAPLAAQAARGGLRVAEAAVTPLAKAEDLVGAALSGAARNILVRPFRVMAPGARKVYNWSQFASVQNRVARIGNNFIETGIPIEEGTLSKLKPEQALEHVNETLLKMTDVSDAFILSAQKRIIRNPDAIIPSSVEVKSDAEIVSQIVKDAEAKGTPIVPEDILPSPAAVTEPSVQYWKDMPEYLDEAGELLDPSVIRSNIDSLKSILDIEKPRGGWKATVRKLQRAIEADDSKYNAELIDGLDDIQYQIDEFLDYDTTGLPPIERGEELDNVFYELQSYLDDLEPSNSFMQAIDDAAAEVVAREVTEENIDAVRIESSRAARKAEQAGDTDAGLAPEPTTDVEATPSLRPAVAQMVNDVESQASEGMKAFHATLRSNVITREMFRGGDKAIDAYVKFMSEKFPNLPDFYMETMFKYWDSQFALRKMIDNRFRSKHPGSTFAPGSQQDILTGIVLSAGAPARATNRYMNHIRHHIMPALNEGVEQGMIERYIQSKRWVQLRRKSIIEIDPDTGKPNYIPGGGWATRGRMPTQKEFLDAATREDIAKIMMDEKSGFRGRAGGRRVPDPKEKRIAAAYATGTRRYDSELPQMTDPLDGNIVYDVTDADIKDWSDLDKIKERFVQINKDLNMTDEEALLRATRQTEVLKEAGDATFDLYREQRRRLYESGLFTKDEFERLAATEDFYNPIAYVEHADTVANGLQREGKGKYAVSTKGLYRFSASPDVMQTLPPLGESMLRNLVRTELRISRNNISKEVVDMSRGLDIFTNDAGQRITRRLPKEIEKDLDIGLKNVTEDFGGGPVPYDEEMKSGYFSFFRNGYREVWGDKDGGPVPKYLWDAVNGRSGMALQPQKEQWKKLAMTNAFFKATYTTYSPLFIVRNGILDSFTAMLRAGINPIGTDIIPGVHGTSFYNNSTIGRVIRSLKNATREAEDRLAESFQLAGGWQPRYFDATANNRKIVEELKKKGHIGDTIIIDAGDGETIETVLINNVKELMNITPPKDLKSRVTRVTGKLPAIGELVEQAPRLMVFEKTLFKKIGKKEYKRLMGVDIDPVKNRKITREEFLDELNREWVPKFDVDDNLINNPVGRRAFVESNEVRLAAANGVEATINFGRGGDMVRWLNQYVLFINAAMEGFKLPFRALGLNLTADVRPRVGAKPGESRWEWASKAGPLPSDLRRGVTGKGFDVVSGETRLFGVPVMTGAAFRMASVLSAYMMVQQNYNKTFKYNDVPLYYDVPEYVRNSAFVIMRPPERDENGDLVIDPSTGRPKPRYIVIPHKLREWSLILSAANLLDEITDRDVAVDKSVIAEYVAKNQFPVDTTSHWYGASGLIPEGVNVLYEIATGKDTFRDRPVVTDDSLEPEEQYTSKTSETMRQAAKHDFGYHALNIPEEYQFKQDIFNSPERLEHLFTNITGSAGQFGLTVSDYIVTQMQDLFDQQLRTTREEVANYREMDSVSRREFRASKTREETEEFDKALRLPVAEVPFVEKLYRTYVPDRGGGLRQRGERKAADLFPDISVEETEDAGRKLRDVRNELRFEQQDNDKLLSAWQDGATKGYMTPKEWRRALSDSYQKYEGAKLGLKDLYQNAIRNKSKEEQNAYYQTIYTVAGKLTDARSSAEVLLSAYHSLEPADDTPDSINREKITEAKNDFMETIRVNSESAGDNLYEEFVRLQQQDMTPARKAYTNATRYLAPYWRIGRYIQELQPNATPEMVQLWDVYINLDSGRQAQMRRDHKWIKALHDKRNDLRKQLVIQDHQRNGYPYMDAMLVFWYGDFYTGNTPTGKAYHTKLHRPSVTLTSSVY